MADQWRPHSGRTDGPPTAEMALLERIGLPEEVELFEEFEELAKTYTIEAPFVSRSQIELMFDVYDGRKLSQGGPGFIANEPAMAANGQPTADNQPDNYKLSLAASESSQQQQHQQRTQDPAARRSVSGLKAIARRNRRLHVRGPNLTWCKLLFVRQQNQPKSTSSSSSRKGTKKKVSAKLPSVCCLSKSETGQDLWLSPSSSGSIADCNSAGGGGGGGGGLQQNRHQPLGFSEEYLNAALDWAQLDSGAELTGALADKENKQEAAELKAEVLQLMAPLLHRLRRSSTVSLDGGVAGPNRSASNLEQQQQQVLLEGSLGAAGRLSVCLFDMKNRTVRLKLEAENGRRWWRLESILDDLRWRLSVGRQPHLGRRSTNKANDGDGDGGADLTRYFDQRHLSRASVLAEERCTRSERLSRENFDRLIALTKDSLNHLIDAQLLLRNKLASELQQQQQLLQPAHLQPVQQQQCLIARENEYESLLRNNFNLLKVWQNLEETKRMACFVCEPIKANLGDLFWFSRQRFNHQTTSDSSCLLSSPLVSLDAIQVKRGLIQILEALHYLHAICKLVHRNVNPSNILIANNDNWKLSGLQFAIRFESATISESASIMAGEGSNMLRYSTTITGGCGVAGQSLSSVSLSAAPSASRLRRQRTLHQTKCEEFSRKAKCANGILQPEVDYLAPEIWKNSKCSHKSDLFSYGLLLGQTYDLFRHKPPISCRSNPSAYERQLKKLVERRKLKLSRLVPLEMREALLATLECEPNLRPSANYALQLFRRPIELCRANDDSLRHLRRSLRFLDSIASPPANLSANPRPHHSSSSSQSQTGQPANNPAAGHGGGNCPPRGRGSYFRKVTSVSANQGPRARQQSKTLHLLNLLLRGVDSLAQMGSLNTLGSETGSDANLAPASTQFAGLRSQFEYTFETLRQLFGRPTHNTWQLSGPGGGPRGAAATDRAAASPTELAANLFAASKPADQRSLMLVIALHRRLLDQLARMRLELPPVCRLAAASSPLNRPGPRHRALAEMEDKLHCLVSRDSLRKLAPILTDPLLKLDEFLLLYELIGDLFAFVGQKCRQNFLQRGKQLLNELTPITGCPSSSSSDDDDHDDDDHDDDQDQDQENFNNNSSELYQQFDTCAAAARTLLLGASRETLNNLPAENKMNNSSRRFSEYPDQTGADRMQVSARGQHRASAGGADYLLQQPQFSTKISITAPSPMGSMRDLNHNSNNSHSHSNHQQHNKNRFVPQRQRQRQQMMTSSDVLCDRTSELSLRTNDKGSNVEVDEYLLAENDQEEAAAADDRHEDGLGQGRSRSASDQGVDRMGDKSRSQLIDELLQSINDDSFTADYVDFNGKFHAATGGHHRAATSTCSSSAVPAGQAKADCATASQLANRSRPKSAMDGSAAAAAAAAAATSTSQQRRQSARPNSLALNSQNRSGATPTSTFDNVIRRMSTNLVQNFASKMNSSTNTQQQLDTTTTTATSISAATPTTAVRREKSSSNYANSLYVDNQVPARRHSDNTINIPRIQVALSSPQAGNSRFGLNQRASVSASKLATKWKLSTSTKANQRQETNDKLSPNLAGAALGYMRRHSSGNTTGNDQNQSNGQTSSSSNLLLNASPFKTKSSSNLGLDFLLSNRSMKRRYSAASMLGHQTQRKAENLIDAGMKSVQNMFG